MQKKKIIIGVVLIIVGAFVFLAGQSVINKPADPLFEWGSTPEEQNIILQGNIAIAIGIILLIAGIVVIIIGATRPDKIGKN